MSRRPTVRTPRNTTRNVTSPSYRMMSKRHCRKWIPMLFFYLMRGTCGGYFLHIFRNPGLRVDVIPFCRTKQTLRAFPASCARNTVRAMPDYSKCIFCGQYLVLLKCALVWSAVLFTAIVLSRPFVERWTVNTVCLTPDALLTGIWTFLLCCGEWCV